MGAEKEREKPTWASRILRSYFRANAIFVARHPHLVIWGSLAFTLAMALKVPFTKKEDDFKYGYTPRNARSMTEMQIYNNFSRGELIQLAMFVVAKDGGSMSRMSHLNETVKLIDEVGGGFKYKNISFYDMCTSFCNFNEPIAIYRNGLALHEQAVESGEQPDVERINLTFPIISFLGRQLDLSMNFYGVKKRKKEDSNITNVAFVKMVCLLYRADRPPQWTDDDVTEWDRKIGRYYREEYESDVIVPRAMSLVYVQDEIVRTAEEVAPYTVIGFCTMSTFAIVTSFLSAKFRRQFSFHKVHLAIQACVSPLLAALSCLGCLLLCGYRFGSILLFTPILVLAIGINDAFILINSWERIREDRLRHAVQDDSLENRMAEVLEDSGPSIMITSLTNMLAFGVGSFTPTPEINLFCIACAVAMFFDYMYTLLFYVGILVLAARSDMEKEKSPIVVANIISRKSHKLYDFLIAYCEWLSSRFTTFTISLILLAYWALGFYGIVHVKTGLDSSKLFLADSPIIGLRELQDNYVKTERSIITVIVNNPGDLTNSSRVDRVNSLVADFEAMPECNGAEFSKFWIRDYQSYLESKDVEVDMDESGRRDDFDPYTVQSVKLFLDWPEYSHWRGCINFKNESKTIDSFFFITAYHGDNLRAFRDKLEMLKRWRAIADNYTDLSASVFEDEAQFSDQIDSLLPLTMQSSIFAFACMVLSCFIFMGRPGTVAIAAFSIASIIIGVAGFLVLWDVTLDPVSMMTIVLSIGISVDFPAHITYHFHRTFFDGDSHSTTHRMAEALSVIGYPLLQCCLANLICVFSVLLVPCYTNMIVFKTMVLVVTFGGLHALVVIPALLCALRHTS